jgi:hypothetical protein
VSWVVEVLPEVVEDDLPAIEKSFKKALKSKRVAEHAFQAVKEEIVSRIGQLRYGPNQPQASLEPRPANAPDLDLWKIRFRFKIPELPRGTANFCRVIYAVIEDAHAIVVIFVYTHAEYSSRPDDRELRRRLLAAQEWARKSRS